jgi:hypothetical protein
MQTDDIIEKLQKAIRETEACESNHIATRHVTESFEGKIAWDGDVEVFALIGHPKAKRCYAWGVENDQGFAATIVLKLPPVESPETAVKMAIASKSRSP